MTVQSLPMELVEAHFPQYGNYFYIPALGGYMLVIAAAVPADTTAGYGMGALCIVPTSGAAAWYVNQGTAISCDFDAVTIA